MSSHRRCILQCCIITPSRSVWDMDGRTTGSKVDILTDSCGEVVRRGGADGEMCAAVFSNSQACGFGLAVAEYRPLQPCSSQSADPDRFVLCLGVIAAKSQHERHACRTQTHHAPLTNRHRGF